MDTLLFSHCHLKTAAPVGITRDSLTGERRHKSAKEGDMLAKWEKRFRRQKPEVNNNAADAR